MTNLENQYYRLYVGSNNVYRFIAEVSRIMATSVYFV